MKIQVEISSHPWRCIEEDGKRCQFLWFERLGTIPVCAMVALGTDRESGMVRLFAGDDGSGCIEKSPACLAITAEEKDK